MDLVVEVEELRVVLLDLGCPVHACLLFEGVELSLNWSVQEQVSLALPLELRRLVPQCLHESLSLNAEMLPTINCPRSLWLEPSIEIYSLFIMELYTLYFFIVPMLTSFLITGGWI